MRILIVGLGIIGGSYAHGLCTKHEVYGIDDSFSTIQQALEKKWIVKTGKVEEIIPVVDLIILAIYPKGIIDFIRTNKGLFKPKQIICDVSGVKGSFIYQVKDYLPYGVEFIGTHPMAGKEKRGISFADKNVFKGANFLITPTADNSDNAIKMIEKIAHDLEFGRISVITPEYHDQVIAFTSQLTHIIAVSLVNSDDDPNTPNNTGDSFRDLTRIAKINEDLWTELFFENKGNLLVQMDKFLQKFLEVKKMIEQDNPDELKQFLIKATEKRVIFDEKNNG